MTKQNLGWIVGFLEGEGCFAIQRYIRRYIRSRGKRVYRYPIVCASQKQKQPLVWLQSLVGGCLYRHRRGYWQWVLNGTKAPLLMRKLYPFMSPRRQRQIRKALK